VALLRALSDASASGLVQAEYEDLYAAARQSGCPRKVILAQAMAKAAQLRADSD
jgi:hypothetical protein